MEPTSIASEGSVAGSSLFVYVEVDIGQSFPERTAEIPFDTLIGTESFASPTLIGNISDISLAAKVTDPMSWYDGFVFLDGDTLIGTESFASPTLIGLISDILLEVKVSDPLSWYDGFAFLDVSTGDGSGGSSEPTQYWSD